MYEGKEGTPVDVIKNKAKGDVDPPQATLQLCPIIGVLNVNIHKPGIGESAWELPDFIKQFGIMKKRQSLREIEDQKTTKAKMQKELDLS
ncbi:hypothetical protein TNCV_2765061 [Trichonephila clavipes]|nr:hypothetical protein TNCV_2765061 [Trichonephila clavipes]